MRYTVRSALRLPDIESDEMGITHLMNHEIAEIESWRKATAHRPRFRPAGKLAVQIVDHRRETICRTVFLHLSAIISNLFNTIWFPRKVPATPRTHLTTCLSHFVGLKLRELEASSLFALLLVVCPTSFGHCLPLVPWLAPNLYHTSLPIAAALIRIDTPDAPLRRKLVEMHAC